ncbi:MAG: glycosyltransferase family 39 protein, partial [Microcoleus sp.]
VIVALFAVGTISAGISSQAETWWNKGSGWLRADLEAARTVNLASNPLIVSDANIAYLMPLSFRLEPKVKLLIQPQCYTSCYRTYRKRRELAAKKTQVPPIPSGFDDVFLYKPSDKLRSGIEAKQNYKIQPVAGNAELNLWKITKK